MSDIKQRLLDACVGHPHAKIEWPHRLLHDASNEIERLEKVLKRVRSAITTGQKEHWSFGDENPDPLQAIGAAMLPDTSAREWILALNHQGTFMGAQLWQDHFKDHMPPHSVRVREVTEMGVRDLAASCKGDTK